jgi:hypothetical protein
MTRKDWSCYLVRYNEETVIFDKVLAIDPKNVLDLNSMYRNW